MFDDEMLYELDEVANLLGVTVAQIKRDIIKGQVTGTLIVKTKRPHVGKEIVIDPTLPRKMDRFIYPEDTIECGSIGRYDKEDGYGFYGIETLFEKGVSYVFEKPFDAVWHISHEELTRLQKDKKNKEKQRKANTESTETDNTAPIDVVQAGQIKKQAIGVKDDDAISEKSKATIAMFIKALGEAYPDASSFIDELSSAHKNDSKKELAMFILALKKANPKIQPAKVNTASQQLGLTIGKSTIEKYLRGDF